MRVLRAEGGAEGVHVGQRTGVGLHVQLAGHGQAGAAAKEILGVVDVALLVHGDIRQLAVLGQHCGHGELLPGALAVCGGDQWSVHVNKAQFVEKLVGGKGHGVTHAHRGGEDLGARSQVRLLSQELKRVLLLCHGVVLAAHFALVPTVHGAKHSGLGHVHFDGLPLGRGSHHHSRDRQRGASTAGLSDLLGAHRSRRV